MWAAGRCGTASSHSDTRYPADCRAKSLPASGSFSALMADAGGQGLEAVVLCSPSPPLSCSNSTMSLLSPLRHQSFPFDDDDDSDGEDEEEVDENAHDSEAKGASLRGMDLRGCAR